MVDTFLIFPDCCVCKLIAW